MILTLNCRFCNEPLTNIFADLGTSPLSNRFLKKEMLDETEKKYPLCVHVCDNCFLVQLSEFETPENIFEDYAYFSSYSITWLQHAENYVNMMIQKFGFNEKNLVIEIASNDGYLLQFFKRKNIPILGVEPAANIAKVAKEKGIPTITKFFGVNTANELREEGKLADLIVGNNVLAHVPNLNDFVKGLKILLEPNGIITMEFPHLLQLIQQNQFDTIYHEHFSYFSFLVVQKIFSSYQLTIFDVDEISTHGGSLRIYARHEENENYEISNNVKKILQKEIEFGLTDISTYINFQNQINQTKKNIREFFVSAKEAHKKIVGYGAAAKGNTLLNFCELGKDFVEFIVDRSPHKQGLFLPGSHIPVKSVSNLQEVKPDYVVILPWNLKDEIVMQTNYIKNWGGKFVILIPKVQIFS